MTEFSIPAPELARLAHNALAFMPARSAVKVCRFGYNCGEVAIGATDLFAVGSDRWFGQGEPGTAYIDLSREDLQVLDKAARAAKKEDVRIVIRHQDGMEFKSESESLTFLDSSSLRQPEDLWDLCDEMLTRLERTSETIVPKFLLLDPALFARFGKIKVRDLETICDLYISDPSEPILVKIGPTFRGCVMPVSRDEASRSESIGVDGLWPGEKVDS